MMFEMWVCEKPWLLKKLMTAPALSGDLSWNLFESDRADSGENPHVLMRYETVKDC